MKTKLPLFQTGLKSFLKKDKKKYFLLLFPIFVVLTFTLVSPKSASLKEENATIILFLNRLLILSDKKPIWISPPAWQVKDFLLADLNHNGQKELNLVVYKKGRYGDLKPFWVKEDKEIGFHFFVLKIDGQKVFPVWQSSQVEKPICKAEAKDTNDDGQEELIVQEGITQEKGFSCQKTIKGIYQWNTWGFTKI